MQAKLPEETGWQTFTKSCAYSVKNLQTMCVMNGKHLMSVVHIQLNLPILNHLGASDDGPVDVEGTLVSAAAEADAGGGCDDCGRDGVSGALCYRTSAALDSEC